MTIVHVETGRRLYGGALQVLYLVRGLRRRGVPSVLLVPKGSQVASRAREWGLPTDEFRYWGEADVTAIGRMARRYRRAGALLVHVHSRRGADTFGGVAAARANVPAVLTRRVDNPEPGWAARRKYPAYSHVVAISDAVRKALTSAGVPPEKISLVPSAVDVSEWGNPRTRSALDRQFNLTTGAPAAAMVAQFIPRKGHRLLVEALAALRAHNANEARDKAKARTSTRGKQPQVPVKQSQMRVKQPQALVKPRMPTVVLFGRGPLKKAVAAWARTAGVADLIRFAGYRDDLPKWLGAFDFLVHPATTEGLGVAVLQAAAAGIPVVASRAGGLPEVVEDRKTGFLFKPGSRVELAATLSAISGAGARLPSREMGRRAHRRVQKLFSVDLMVNGCLDVYRSVLGPEWQQIEARQARPQLALVR